VPYLDAATTLAAAAARADVDLSLKTPEADATPFMETVFGKPLADDIAAHGYPSDVEVPWVVEELYVYDLNELSDRQAGYRVGVQDGRPVAGWDAGHFVIADWAANPVTVAPNGGIHYARHGEGAWDYHRICADLPTFFLLLAAWLGHVAEHGENLHDGNFDIPDTARETIRRLVSGVVDIADQDAACNFLLGER
jgi:hypothetical protein